MKANIIRRFLAAAGMTIVMALLMISAQTQVRYINTSFENASQLDWQVDSATGVVNISLIYDRERSSVNRANGHWHFQVQAERGSDVIIVLKNFENIWNKCPGTRCRQKPIACYLPTEKNGHISRENLRQRNI
jgi:hypothetical protein